MPRVARIVLPDVPHHVTQRGNNQQDVFFVDDDRRAYLKLLAQQYRLHGVRVLAYCLMSNHVHLLAIPSRSESLARAIGRTHWLYAQYVNRLHGRSGHLWQNRFYSSASDEESCLLVARYIERNPVRARLCRIARRYVWSSAAAHCGRADESGLLDMSRWRALAAGVDWERELHVDVPEIEQARIRRSIHTGRPLASDRFLSKLEKKLGKRLRPLPVGRPKKAVAKRAGKQTRVRK